jgi:HD-GYP domain-containing protein (c-di-GMP phosphodiesterase class II)
MSTLRMAEILGALSLATDLANGQPSEHCLRCAILATRLARDELHAVQQDVYWTALLRYVGCNGFAVEEAGYAAGDDIGLRASFMRADLGRPSEFIGAVLRDVGRGAPLVQRMRGVTRLLTTPTVALAHAQAQCDAGVHCAHKLGMGSGVIAALAQADERYDGHGQPAGKHGEDLSLAIRYVEAARVAVTFHGIGGVAAARAELQRRAEGHVDPRIVGRFDSAAEALCAALSQSSVWDEFLAAEPGCWLLDEDSIAPLFEVFALFADLKSGYLTGHSHGVAALAEAAARLQGLPPDETAVLARAALLHDLGRVSVPTGVWDKPGPLSAAEWERVRLHSYYTDRVLRRSPLLARYADVASRAHERLDGSGYHRGESAAATDRMARLLAAADTYRACTEDRAHRPALPADAARRELLQGAAQGRLCRHAVDAVLAAGGQQHAPRRSAPAGEALSARELDVLRLLVRGLTNKQIAKALAISPRTVQHHTLHIYSKTGMTSRAGAALYAVQHALLP